MFIGSNYALKASAEGQTVLGFPHLHIVERVLSRTKTRKNAGGRVEVTSYHYTLLCIVGGGDYESVEIDEEELQSEIISGYYELVPERVQP